MPTSRLVFARKRFELYKSRRRFVVFYAFVIKIYEFCRYVVSTTNHGVKHQNCNARNSPQIMLRFPSEGPQPCFNLYLQRKFCPVLCFIEWNSNFWLNMYSVLSFICLHYVRWLRFICCAAGKPLVYHIHDAWWCHSQMWSWHASNWICWKLCET